ncbi:MAG: hypothetical protein NTX82_05150 [Candidatus Parcubacteria bacterium]|nr:hypothetical protein [Candidatus Parcubacteria bacterium]
MLENQKESKGKIFVEDPKPGIRIIFGTCPECGAHLDCNFDLNTPGPYKYTCSCGHEIYNSEQAVNLPDRKINTTFIVREGWTSDTKLPGDGLCTKWWHDNICACAPNPHCTDGGDIAKCQHVRVITISEKITDSVEKK